MHPMAPEKDLCTLATDAVGDFLDAELAARKGEANLRPIYTYPMNGLRPLVDKPLKRPRTEEKASH